MIRSDIDPRTAHIVNLIKTTRVSRGLSQRELSELSGISTTSISKIENHGVTPRITNLLKLCSVLGIDINLKEIKSDIFDNSLLYHYENDLTSNKTRYVKS